jgi:hypothetical protein
MGMDVIGNDPENETGEYFRNNVWWWRPLWNYCEVVAPELTKTVKYAQSNDGDGLKAKESLLLSKLLFNEVQSGRTAEYEAKYYKELAELPVVDDKPDWNTNYPFSVENVKEFAVFLQYSGGFAIC